MTACVALILQTTTLRTSGISRARGGPTVEKLVFNNHTECICVDRLEEFMPRDRPSSINDKENSGRHGVRDYYSSNTNRYDIWCDDSECSPGLCYRVVTNVSVGPAVCIFRVSLHRYSWFTIFVVLTRLTQTLHHGPENILDTHL